MNFFDEDPISLPNDGQYYFNILVVCAAINPANAEQYLGKGIDEIQYTENLTAARPYLLYCFIDDELDKDTEFEIECYPHCVVEVSEQLGISWWEMLDFESEDTWRIEPEDETDYY